MRIEVIGELNTKSLYYGRILLYTPYYECHIMRNKIMWRPKVVFYWIFIACESRLCKWWLFCEYNTRSEAYNQRIVLESNWSTSHKGILVILQAVAIRLNLFDEMQK